MEIIKSHKRPCAISLAKRLRLKTRITKKVHKNKTEPRAIIAMLYTVKVQVKILGAWGTVWAETCDYSDGDTRQYINIRAEKVHEALTDKI